MVHDSHTTTGAANQAPDLKVEKGEGLCLTHFLVLGFLVPWSFSHFLWTTLFICLCMYVMNVRRCYMYIYIYIYIYIHTLLRSLLQPLSSWTEHSRLVVHHCRNSSVLSLLLVLFRCACVSYFCILVQFF